MNKTSHFPESRMYRLQQMEQNHFWFKGRRRLVNQLLKQYFPVTDKRIIDIGCGTGATVKYLTDQAYNVIGVDMHHVGLHHAPLNSAQHRLVQGDALQLPFKQSSFQLALLLDIMEHTDDISLLQQVHDCLAPDGKVLISVPAIPWLWSYRDTAAGHLRRYTAQTLTTVVEANGFEIQAMRRYQFFALPLLIITRLFGKQSPTLRDKEDTPHPVVNFIMTWLSFIEVELGRVIPMPWGSTIILVCRRLP